MINTIRHKLIERLAGTTIIEDPDIDETIYPLTMSGTIAVRNLESDVDIYEATAVINHDNSLTICANGNIIAYYPTSTYEAVVTL